MFTVNTKINIITSQPEFAGHEYMIGLFPNIDGIFPGTLTLSTMANEVGWNAESIADGINYLLQCAKAGKVFYDIYSEAEQESDPSKKLTGIAAFPLKEKRPFVVVCAGGGYANVCSMIEAYPVIKELNRIGYAAFSMQYRCGKDAIAPHPMDDLAQAIRFILDHAEELNVEISGYAVMGFSAGGHLAASFGTENLGWAYYGLPVPATMILCYPVITMGAKTHDGSRQFLLDDLADDPTAQKKYSIEQQVSDRYPATYVWQFDADDTVPIDNSRMLMDALRKNNIPNKYETFPGTLHGAGLGTGTPAEGWLERAVAFWRAQTYHRQN